jgi:hypothetical protein
MTLKIPKGYKHIAKENERNISDEIAIRIVFTSARVPKLASFAKPIQ